MEAFKTFCMLICAFAISGCASELSSPSSADHPSLIIADAARIRGDIPQAIHEYKEAMKEETPHEKTYVGLGMSLLDANEVDEAKIVFDKAFTLFPKSAAVHVGLGSTNLTINHPENALKSFDCALALDPQNVKALNGRGIALDMLGDHKGAEANYRAAMELAPDNMSFKSNLALSMALMGNTAEAIHILEKLCASPNATPRIRQNLALAYGLAGDLNMAKKIGKVDLSEDMVKNNISYMEIIQKTNGYSGLISKNHTTSLNAGRKWQEN